MTYDVKFDTRPGKSKDFKKGTCCVAAKQVALKSKNKDYSLAFIHVIMCPCTVTCLSADSYLVN